MSYFLESIKKVLYPYYNYITVIIVLVIFIIAGYYAFNTFFSNKNKQQDKKFKDVANAKPDDIEVIIYFFHVDWCPHCKKALPDWEKFKNKYNDQSINGYVVKCISINCTEENDTITNFINEYKIDGYPTIKMLKSGQQIEFDAKITENTLEQFVETMLEN